MAPGQWSLPITLLSMEAFLTLGKKLSITKKNFSKTEKLFVKWLR
jgi:hypothetical protein